MDTSLIDAVEAADLARVRAALDAGADPNTKGKTGVTPLMRAAAGGRVEVVEALLDAGADVNLGTVRTTHSPLCDAADSGHLEVVRLLLARGADPVVAVGRRPEIFLAPGHPNFGAILRELRAAARGKRKGREFPSAHASVGKIQFDFIEVMFVRASADEAVAAVADVLGLAERVADVYHTTVDVTGRWFLVGQFRGQGWSFVHPAGGKVERPDFPLSLARTISERLSGRTAALVYNQVDDQGRYFLYDDGRVAEEFVFAEESTYRPFLARDYEQELRQNPFASEECIAERLRDPALRASYDRLRAYYAELEEHGGRKFRSELRTLAAKDLKIPGKVIDGFCKAHKIYVPLMTSRETPPTGLIQIHFSDYTTEDFVKVELVGSSR